MVVPHRQAPLTSALVVLTAVGSAGDADRIATALVEGRFAACVNIVPGVRSIYRWQGAVQRDDELLLVMKTTAERFPELRAAIVALHPYELPEVVALPVTAAHPPYLDWITASTEDA